MRSISAKFESRCPVCDEMIYEGDEIVSVEGEWWHEECRQAEGVDEGYYE